MRSSAAPLGNLLMDPAKSFTASLRITTFPSLVFIIVCSTALSAKADCNCTGSEFFMPSNNKLTAAFTESSIVCAGALKLMAEITISRNNSFITNFFKV